MNTIANKYLTVSISSFGAELTSIIANASGKEYLWQADPIFWKRHSPILFPIVGGVWNNQYRYNGKIYHLSQHGFARDKEFELILDSPDALRYRLVSDSETCEVYPFDFELIVEYKLSGNKLQVSWTVINKTAGTIFFQIGAHPAFNFPDFDPASEHRGYFAFGSNSDNLQYIRLGQKGCADIENVYDLNLNQERLLPITPSLFDKDALIFENSQISRLSLLNQSKRPEITLHFDTPLVALWSPPGKHDCPFVCIEPWYGRCDSVGYDGEFAQRDWMNSLAPDGVFDASYTIEVGE